MELIVTGLDIPEKAKIFTDELFRSLGGKEHLMTFQYSFIEQTKRILKLMKKLWQF